MNCPFKCTHCFAKKLELDDGTKRSTTLLFIYYYCFLLACAAEERLEPSRAGHFCWGRPDDPPSPIHPEGWHVPEEFRNSTPIDEDGMDGMLEFLNFSDIFGAAVPKHKRPPILDDGGKVIWDPPPPPPWVQGIVSY